MSTRRRHSPADDLTSGRKVCPLILLWTLLCAGNPGAAQVPSTAADFDLAGTQPGDLVSSPIEGAESCVTCHGNYDPTAEPYFPWKGSIKAHTARDPLFRAALSIANQDAAQSGRHCIRCHAPNAFLNDHLSPPDGSPFDAIDRNGINCDFCHRLVDPIDAMGVAPPEDQVILDALTNVPAYYANAMCVLDPAPVKRGPYGDPVTAHSWLESPVHRSADSCGACHDGGNPLLTRQPDGTYQFNTHNQATPDEDPATQMPLTRTFSEWSNSTFAQGGVDMGGRFGGNQTVVSSCQDCHMPKTTGKGCILPSSPLRSDLGLHEFSGSSVWILDTLPVLYPDDPDIDLAALSSGRSRSVSMLQRAASMQLTRIDDQLRVRTINETGHKLPTGHALGRRTWINVKYYDQNEQLIEEYGAYDPVSANLDDTTTRVYEFVTGLDAHGAQETSLPQGAGPHTAVNNVILKDNRIPPRGFTNAAYDPAGAPVVGHAYPDGQYWDDVYFDIPQNTARIVVTLNHQSASASHIQALRDLNVSDTWGTDLYDAWEATAKAPPVTMLTGELLIGQSPGGSTLRINAGGSDYTDTQGRLWSADAWYEGGKTDTSVVQVDGTEDDALYETQRRWACGDFTGYRIPVIPGTYLVTLHFSENSLALRTGDRVFDVWVAGRQAAAQFDIYDQAGSATAATRAFVADAAEGWIPIQLVRDSGSPTLAAIEIVPAETGPKLTVFDTPFDVGTSNPALTMSTPLRVHSIGTEPVVISGLTLTGADASQFSVTDPGLPRTVPPGHTLTVPLSMTPTGSDGPRSATLEIENNDPAESVILVALTGTVTTGLLPLGFEERTLSTDITFPTSLCFGPGPGGEENGRLYATEVDGTIRVFTLDAARNVTGVQVFTAIKESPNYNEDGTPASLGARQTTGILVDPLSPPEAPVLYVTHSDPRWCLNKEPQDCPVNTRSGVLTRLIGPDFDDPVGRADLLVGLPRSRENHSPNGLQAADEEPGGQRWLYVGLGGNTNYGAPSLVFSRMDEVPWSASIIRYNLNSPQSLAGQTITLVDPTINGYDPPKGVEAHAQLSDQIPDVVEIYATGHRNPYDLLLHGNGRFYTTCNEGNGGMGTTPAGPGGDPPALSLDTMPDLLLRFDQGAYGGHPNPSRGEYVWHDGSVYDPDQPRPPNYVDPLYAYGDHTSTCGITEYTSNVFDGRMIGDIITVNYAVGQNTVRVKLSPDGLSTTGAVELITGLANPLDVVTDPQGRLFIAHNVGGGRISLFTPLRFFDPADVDGDGTLNDADNDDDNDGYDDLDEVSAGADPFNPADIPADHDGDFVSDTSDADDDNDGLADTTDQLPLDAGNGSSVALPRVLDWEPQALDRSGIAESGFTGSLLSGAGGLDARAVRHGAVNGWLTVEADAGTAAGASNDQRNALQVGLDAGGTSTITVSARIVAFAEGVTLDGQEAGGIFFGIDEDNFVRLALTADLQGAQSGTSGIQFALETGGTFDEDPSSANVPVAFPGPVHADLFLTLDPQAQTATAKYRLNSDFGADIQALGTISLPPYFFVTGTGPNPGPASNGAVAGIMTTKAGSTLPAFEVTYDWFRLDEGSEPPDAATAAEADVVYRINCGGSDYDDVTARSWSADAFFSGGTPRVGTEPIADTFDDPLFQSARIGPDEITELQYVLPAPTGSYEVTLLFAETEYGNGQGGVGSRVLDIGIQDQAVFQGLDLLALGGFPNRAIRLTFGTRVGEDGLLEIDLVPVSGRPLISGIEVLVTLGRSDFSRDGWVDLTDFVTFANCFGAVPGVSQAPGCSPEDARRCDLNGDCLVGLTDFITFAADFGQ